MPNLADDFRQRLCPQCGEKGIYRDPSNGYLRCKFCKASGFQLPTLPPSKQPSGILPQQPVPAIPPNTPVMDIVDDYFVDNRGKRHKISSVHAPKIRPAPPVTAFDPLSPWAKIAEIRFREQAKQRKRLNRDVTRRAKERGEELKEWSEEWEKERGPIPIAAADRLLDSVRQSVRRKRKERNNVD